MSQQLMFELGISSPVAADLGEVFTRRWIVDLILDLGGYKADNDLGALVAVEPSCGDGAFLGPMVERLLESSALHGRPIETLMGCLRAFDLSVTNVDRARKVVIKRLTDDGAALATAEALAKEWIKCGDYLLNEGAPADLVVGNPPYIRLESVPPERSAAYRTVCPTMRGRSDVYVGFIEHGLRQLKPDGALAFIVADRWMHNEYGADLRELIASEFAVETVIEMHEVDAFEESVSAYPAIVVLRNSEQQQAVIAQAGPEFDEATAIAFEAWARRSTRSFRRKGCSAARLNEWFVGRDLWPSGSPEALAVVADLERRFAPLEDPATGTRVGIGVASGADSVFVTSDEGIVERDRLMPLVSTADVASGTVDWSKRYLVNPWDEHGLVDLDDYPKLRSYLERNEQQLRKRHVAQKRPESWFRTIDRVDPLLRARPKLLIPDIKASSHPVLDRGELYPHHNLYFVTSEVWDLEVLGGLLLSDVANLFVGAYCVKMRGGSYRFQAQYLRRIRVPNPSELSAAQRRELRTAFRNRDVAAATRAAVAIYGVTSLPQLR